MWPHFCVVAIMTGLEGLINVFSPYLVRDTTWPGQYTLELVLAFVHTHVMVAVFSAAAQPACSLVLVLRVLFCQERVQVGSPTGVVY